MLSCERGWLNNIISSNIEGCMDSNACNYNSDATKDDNSCLYPPPNLDCDLNCIGSYCNLKINNSIELLSDNFNYLIW